MEADRGKEGKERGKVRNEGHLCISKELANSRFPQTKQQREAD